MQHHLNFNYWYATGVQYQFPALHYTEDSNKCLPQVIYILQFNNISSSHF